jgi:PAS domain S-box-containing protein
MDDLVFTLDREQRHVEVFGRWLDREGWTPDSLLGKTAREIFGPEAAPVHEAANRRALAGESITYEWSVAGRDGARHFRTTVSPVRGPGGKVTGVVGLGREITEHRRAERALTESRSRLQALFDNTFDAIVLVDDGGRLADANSAACSLLGYGRDALGGMYLWDLTPPENRERVARSWRDFLSTGTRRGELVVRTHDGATRAIELRAVANVLSGLHLAIGRDVTESQRVERALRASEARYRLLFDRNPLPMWVYDTQTHAFLDVNEAAARHHGYSREELLRMTLEDLHPAEDIRSLHASLAAGRPGWGEAGIRRHRRKDGTVTDDEVAYYDLPAEPLPSRLVVLRDVTHRLRAEAVLEARARQQAAVARLGVMALSGADCDALMGEALHFVSETLEVEYCEVLELLPGGKELRWRAGVGWKDGLVGSARVSAGASSQAGFTLLASAPVVVRDLRTETRFRGSPPLVRHGVVSGMSVVIPSEDQPFGVLGAHTAHRRDFTEDDVHFLQSVANVLAAAILRDREKRVRQRLVGRVLSAQEDERQRIAREIHDEAGQSLTASLVGLRAIEDARTVGQAWGVARRLRRIVSRTIEDLGRLARGLHPGVLHDVGLEVAVTRTAEDFGRSHGVAVETRTTAPGSQRLPPRVEIALYRILQEALTNVAKHARATAVRVILDRSESAVHLRVEDNGIGFDARAAPSGPLADGHLGLVGMQERAVALGGCVAVESRPGEGTKLWASIPLSDPASRNEEGGPAR